MHVSTRRAQLALLAAALLTSACGSSSIAVTEPTAPKCQVSATNSLASAPADGGNGTIAIDTTRDCTWTATSAASWIALTSEVSGQGSGSVTYHVAANADPTPRKAMVGVNDAQVVVAQDAGVCRFTIGSATATMSAAGGSVTIAVTASAAACAWTTASSVAWIDATSPSASGNGNATFTVKPNVGDARIGVVTVAGQTVTVTQGAATMPPPPPPTPTCTYALDSTSQSVGADGGSQHAGVKAPAGCAWTAASNVPWMAVTDGATGSGGGQVTYSVAANTGAARSGTLTIAGLTLTVTQPSAACTFVVAPTTQTIAAAGGQGAVTVTTRSDCSWSASTDSSWLQITAGASGSGDGTVTFTVAANGGAARSAVVTIAGRTATVSQAAAPCAFSVTPPTQAIAPAGGSGSAAIATSSGCDWTAASNAAWITITSPATGTGAGSVTFNAAANATGASRSGTLTIAGQTIAVTQDAAAVPCSYSLSPTGQSVSDGASAGSVTVTTAAGCAWSATSNADWLTFTTPASGTGNGTVGFAVAANTSTAARSGTLSIAGQTFTVTQAAPAGPFCAYAIAPSSRRIGANGSFEQVNVTTGVTCAWSAVAHVEWLAVAPPGSGTGNGSVSIVVGRNRGAERVGTVSIADQTFTVTQTGDDQPVSPPEPLSPSPTPYALLVS